MEMRQKTVSFFYCFSKSFLQISCIIKIDKFKGGMQVLWNPIQLRGNAYLVDGGMIIGFKLIYFFVH